MLYDPGPLTLFTTAEFPVAGVRPNFVGLAADQVAPLVGHEAALVGAQNTMGADLAVNHDAEGALDLAAAAAEMDGQAHAFDLTIGDVAGSALTLEGDLTGLNNDLAGQLAAAPAAEVIPYPGNAYVTDDGLPDPIITIEEWYRTLLGREVTPDELMAHVRNPGGLEAVYHLIVSSEEYLARVAANTPGPVTQPPGYHGLEYWADHGVPYSQIVDDDGNLRPGWARTANGYEFTPGTGGGTGSGGTGTGGGTGGGATSVSRDAFTAAYQQYLNRPPDANDWRDFANWEAAHPGVNWLPQYIAESLIPRRDN